MKKSIIYSCLFQAIILCCHQMSLAQSTNKPKKTIIIMIDGFGENYYRNSDMPDLNKCARLFYFNTITYNCISPDTQNIRMYTKLFLTAFFINRR